MFLGIKFYLFDCGIGLITIKGNLQKITFSRVLIVFPEFTEFHHPRIEIHQ